MSEYPVTPLGGIRFRVLCVCKNAYTVRIVQREKVACPTCGATTTLKPEKSGLSEGIRNPGSGFSSRPEVVKP